MDLAAVAQGVARPWAPRFAPRETAPATVKCLLSRKPMGTKHGDSCQHPLWTRGVSNGAQPDATSGGTRAVATIQSAVKEDQEPVDGSTTSQVS